MTQKHALLTLVFFIALFSGIVFSGEVSNSSSGLVAVYHFNDGTANDFSGNSNNGIISGATYTAAGGKFSGAFNFDGVNDGISITNTGAFNFAGPFSVSVWVKIVNNGALERIVSNWWDSGGQSFQLFYDSRTAKVFGFEMQASSKVNSTFSTIVDQTQWYHIVGTYDGSNQKLYVNGELKNTKPNSGTPVVTTNPIYIGRNRTGQYFNGTIDDVAIWNRALSAAEIQEIYSGITPPSGTCYDITGDDIIDILDLVQAGNKIGTADSTADINDDGIVNVFDLIFLVQHFGSCTNPEPQLTVSANPQSTTFTSSQSVSLSSNDATASIYYTINETPPTSSSTLYNSPILITSTTKLKFIAIKGNQQSNVITENYTKIVEGPAPIAVIGNSVTQNIAPLTVLFSGADSTASGSAELTDWEWDFGDTSSADSSTGKGKLVTHRFDNPGTYTVKLRVKDSEGIVSQATEITITALQFTGTVYYVSNTGDNANNGLSESAPFKDLDYAITTAKATSTSAVPNKILLKKNNEWLVIGRISIDKRIFIDSYGSGEMPLVKFTNFTYPPATNRSDLYLIGGGIRIENIRFDCVPTPDHPKCGGITAWSSNSIIRNVIIENARISGQLPSRGLVVEDTIIRYAGGSGISADGNYITIRRSTLEGSGSDNGLDHQLYLSRGENWLIEDSLFDGTGGHGNFGMKINSARHVIIRNVEVRNTRNGISIGTNNHSYEWLSEDVTIENSSSHNNGSDNQTAAVFIDGVKDVTIRNNLFYNNVNKPNPDGGQAAIGFAGDNKGQLGTIKIYNNVFYENRVRDILVPSINYIVDIKNNIFYRTVVLVSNSLLHFTTGAGASALNSNTVINNNLYYYPVIGQNIIKIGNTTYAMDWMKSNGYETNGLCNSGDDNVCDDYNPLFSNPVSFNFSLALNSPAIDSGTFIKSMLYDFQGISRPQGSAYDLGAYESG
ncbi:MAG: PKD domain-containing protein [archaeon]|nr:PKD domain-containing protein [archaeon]